MSQSLITESWANPALPAVAIAVPVGGWSPLLPAALRSLAMQNVSLQIALLDASGDSRVKQAADASGFTFAYRRSGPDGGQTDAIAEGWRETDAEIVGWLNADDILLPGALEAAASAFAADPDLDVWFGQSTIIDSFGATVGVHGAVEAPGPLLLRSCTISQPSCFVRRRAMEAAGGLDRTLHYTMDWDLWTRLYAGGAKMEMTARFLSAVLWAEGTKTASMPADRLREIAAIVRRHHGRYTAAKTQTGFLLHHLLSYTLLNGPARRLRRRGWLPEAAAASAGISGSGRIAKTAELPVINLGGRPGACLRVRFAGPDARRARAVAGGAEGEGGDLLLEAGPVAPGNAMSLRMHAPEGARVYFDSAAWEAERR